MFVLLFLAVIFVGMVAAGALFFAAFALLDDYGTTVGELTSMIAVNVLLWFAFVVQLVALCRM